MGGPASLRYRDRIGLAPGKTERPIPASDWDGDVPKVDPCLMVSPCVSLCFLGLNGIWCALVFSRSSVLWVG